MPSWIFNALAGIGALVVAAFALIMAAVVWWILREWRETRRERRAPIEQLIQETRRPSASFHPTGS